jgi:hypothetical protein
MKTFTLYWLTGDKEIVQGVDVADAVRRSGYSGGALRALDFWTEGTNENWNWNSKDHKWEWSESPKKKKFGLIK